MVDDSESHSLDTMQRRIRRRVSSRSRYPFQQYITQGLGICLVVGFVVFNIIYFEKKKNRLSLKTRTVRAREQWVTPTSQAFNDNGVAHKARNLIIVAGHSVTTSGHLEDADHDEADWFLLDYQKRRGLPEAIAAHIKAGVQAANSDPHGLLVFSGGETRATAGPDTEGSSYFRVTDAMNWWPRKSNVRSRTLAEEFATDSFQNLLFSICRFYEVTGRYPEKITVVSFTFKERRFAELHAKALRWPSSQFFYVGVDPSPSDGFKLEEASKGEMENAAKPFEDDPYGCNSPVLREKRALRNPFYRTPPYDLSCPDMQEILHYCNPEMIPKDKT
eukprot:CAMPEP_0198148324 /NCGR_PEP_ID=MMETSP1443-20131203/40879_1 /TAXON_ID=186043 /ORGANISM="Entomoneis sp., Strain CCMP2396" /LENGTH=331 /DNA_ID=CAMNT_0043812981 /DNA_START=151 /DNA_END=1143 /DNA_ORIENTATION=+